MSDAPERIWLDLERIPSRHTCSPSEATPHDVKYIRADLSDALLREAVAALKSIANNTCCDGCREAALVARAALKGGDQ